MNNSDFIYTTYIRSTPEKVWNALTNPEFIRQYWGGYENISDWKKGSKWQHVSDKGETMVIGEVLESNPPTRLVYSWAEPNDPSDVSKVTFEIDQNEEMVCLRVTHGNFKAGSTMRGKISQGWPKVISSLKSFLETGEAFDIRKGKLGCGRSE